MKWKVVAVVTTTSLFLLAGCGTAKVNTMGAGTGSSNTPQTAGNAVNSVSTGGAVQEPSPLLNKQAPAFTMEVYGGNGKKTSLKQILAQGKPVILNAFASWCPPCNMEAPDFKKLQQQYKGKIQVVGVDMTSYDTVSGLKKFVKKYQLPYTVLMDKKSVFENSYDVAYYPTTFGLSPTGQIKVFHVGYMSKSDMETMVQQLLKASK